MKSLADALVYVVTFINAYSEEDGGLENRTACKVTESIAYELRNATDQEMDALAIAAEQALAEELAAPYPRKEWAETYKNWMESMFGEGDWQANKRKDHGTNETAA